MSETSSQLAPRPRRSGTLTGLLFGVIIALMLTLLAARVKSGPLAVLWSLLSGRSTHIASEGSVVERIQSLQRLETVVYSMDKIITGERENPVLPDFLAGDRILMLVHGQVVAGIDFARLGSGDIKIQGKAVHVHLPNPQVLMTPLPRRAKTIPATT
jgi:hypothetical protein